MIEITGGKKEYMDYGMKIEQIIYNENPNYLI